MIEELFVKYMQESAENPSEINRFLDILKQLIRTPSVVGAMRRQGAEGDFRSNLHQGGSATAHKLSRKEKSTALAAAKAMGLGVCGVDMIPFDRGPLVMEVNSSPGLEGIEKATSVNIAGKIMDYIEANTLTTDNKKRRRKKDNIGA